MMKVHTLNVHPTKVVINAKTHHQYNQAPYTHRYSKPKSHKVGFRISCASGESRAKASTQEFLESPRKSAAAAERRNRIRRFATSPHSKGPDRIDKFIEQILELDPTDDISMVLDNRVLKPSWLTTLLTRLSERAGISYTMRVFQWAEGRPEEYSLNEFHFTSCIRALGRAGKWRDALMLYDKMKSSGVAASVVTFTALMSCLTQAGQWERALSLWQELTGPNATQQEVKPDRILYTCFFKACDQGNQAQMALQVYDKMVKDGITPDVVLLNTLMGVCGRSGRWQHCKRLFHQMQAPPLNLVPDTVTYNILITASLRSQEIANKAIKGGKRGEDSQSNGPAAAPGEALWLHREMLDRGLTPDLLTLNALLKACCQAPTDSASPDLFPQAEQLFRSAGETDKVSASVMMSGLLQRGRWEDALQVFHRHNQEEEEDTTQGGKKVDLTLAGQAITACGAGGKWEQALEIYDSIRDQGERCPRTRGAVVMALDQAGQSVAAIEAVEKMLKDGVKPLEITWNIAMQAAFKLERLETAQRMVDRMLDLGVKPTVETFTALVCTAGACGDGPAALAASSRMQSLGVRPDTVFYSALITALDKSGNWSTALDVFDQMQEMGVERNVVTFTAAIRACVGGARCDSAVDLLSEMKAGGLTPNVRTYNAVLAACSASSEWKLAESIFTEMKLRSVEPNTVTFNTLITACGKSWQWERAVSMYEEMKNTGVKPNKYTFEALILACEEGGEWKLALQFYEEQSKVLGLAPSMDQRRTRARM